MAVTKRGDICRLNERTTGEAVRGNQKFTVGLELESVGRTREIMQDC